MVFGCDGQVQARRADQLVTDRGVSTAMAVNTMPNPGPARDDPATVMSVRGTSDKVDLVAFHPASPWLAYVTRDSVVTVWDYAADQVCPRAKAWVRCVFGC